jgi:glycine/D-amino acid oxidase-like deaminating enzyme
MNTTMNRVRLPPSQQGESKINGSSQAKLPCPYPSASFWHSEPNAFLLNHRTTTELPESADIVIVGSGITGVSVARYLSEDARAKAISVVMLEAREICSGATGRNGGHCKADLLENSSEVAAFEMKNVEAVRSYVEQNKVQCEWQDISGCVTFWNEKLFTLAKKKYSDLRKTDPDMADLTDLTEDKEVMRRHRVRPECVGMLTTRHDGQLWPYKYVTFMAEKLVKEGRLNLQTLTPVASVEFAGGVRNVRTPRGVIKAKHVILATNGYTSHILDHFSDVIVPIRGQMLSLHPPQGSTIMPHSYGMVGYGTSDPETDDYLIQRPFQDIDGERKGGHLMYGGGRSYAKYNTVGESADDIVDPGEADYLRSALPHMLDLGDPEQGELVASHQWTGIMGRSRDNMPWVGRVPRAKGERGWESGLWLCAGYSGHGMPNATLCARAIVHMILAGEDAYSTVSKSLIENGDLPQPYLISHERLEAARSSPIVARMEQR